MTKPKRSYTRPPKAFRPKTPKVKPAPTGRALRFKGKPHPRTGSKDKVLHGRVAKASVKAIIEEIVSDPTGRMTIERAIRRGINASPRDAKAWVEMAANYMDGKPVDSLNLKAQVTMDEVSTAKLRLESKMNTLLNAVLAKRKKEEAPQS